MKTVKLFLIRLVYSCLSLSLGRLTSFCQPYGSYRNNIFFGTDGGGTEAETEMLT